MEVDAASIRTLGARPEQLVLAATATDVQRVIVAGCVVADRGRLVGSTAVAGTLDGSPAHLLRDALTALDAASHGKATR